MIFRFLMLISLVFVVFSCQKSDPAPIEVVTVDQEFDLSLSQTINEGVNTFVINVKSMDISECKNAELDAFLTQNGNDLTIQINGNILTSDCIEGGIYTEKNLVLPNTPGQYNIEIIQGELSSTNGSLNINETDFNLTIDNLGGIFYEGQNLKIIPKFLGWGFYGDQMPNSTTQTFLEEMVTELGFKQNPFENLEDGDYSRFRVENGILIMDDVDIDHITVAYNFEDEVTWQKLLNRLPEFNLSFPRLKYRIERWDGQFAAN